MYAILISTALAIYSLILVDFSQLHQGFSLHNDLITSTQAFYAAEGGVEMALSSVGDQAVYSANIAFEQLAEDSKFQKNTGELSYQEGITSTLEKKQLDLNVSHLTSKTSRGFKNSEPLASRGFALREILPEDNFNELRFNFNQDEEESEIAMDIFAFPREGDQIDFADFQTLKDSPQGSSIKRLTVNTRDVARSEITLGQTLMLPTQVKTGRNPFKKQVILSGLNPLKNNYLIFFQTLDNQPIHFELTAFHQGENIVLPGMLQTVDVTASTPTGLFQRVRFQRESEELLVPGLNFVHFSDHSIVK